MNRDEFAGVMAYLAAGCGKPIDEHTAEVYYDLLGDLPLAALQVAAKQVLLENKFPVFPTVGTLRDAATKAMMGERPLAIEAWGLAIRAVNSFGLDQKQKALASLPPLVAQAVDRFGWRALCDSTEPEVARAQFTKAYESLAVTEMRQALLPAAVKDLLKQVGLDARAKEIENRNDDQELLRNGHLPLDKLRLPAPALNKLREAGFQTIGDLPARRSVEKVTCR